MVLVPGVQTLRRGRGCGQKGLHLRSVVVHLREHYIKYYIKLQRKICYFGRKNNKK
jgi:hypothetical protein